MLTLCMDTSHKFLTIILLNDYKVIYTYQEECLKKQSELIFTILQDMCKKSGIKPENIDEIVISKGPGSYTGVRIAMTIAKVMCSLKNIPLYTIDTIKLYSSGNKNTAVVMDARSNRCYFGVFDNGNAIIDTKVLTIEEITPLLDKYNFVGDLYLFGKENIYLDMSNAFISLKDKWEKVENIHLLTPKYLKEATSYMVK